MDDDVLIYDDVYRWQGWGGQLRLGSGRCRLRIFDLRHGQSRATAHLKPIIAVVSDLPKEKINDMSVRSCTSHIASCVVRDFGLEPQRMLWIEYDPPRTFGREGERRIEASLTAVDFAWHDNMAIEPRWRSLQSPLSDTVLDLLAATES